MPLLTEYSGTVTQHRKDDIHTPATTFRVFDLDNFQQNVERS
jgi:hypothetical protein